MTTSLTLELYAMSTSVLIKCSKASANRHLEAVRLGGAASGEPGRSIGLAHRLPETRSAALGRECLP